MGEAREAGETWGRQGRHGGDMGGTGEAWESPGRHRGGKGEAGEARHIRRGREGVRSSLPTTFFSVCKL